MAEDKDESQEKTQEPTARRLEKAKEDGKVLSSKEAFVFSSMFMGVLLFYLAPMLLDDFLKICKSLFSFGPELASGKSPRESVAVVVKFFIQVFLIFSIPLLVVSVPTQFLIGGINSQDFMTIPRLGNHGLAVCSALSKDLSLDNSSIKEFISKSEKHDKILALN